MRILKWVFFLGVSLAALAFLTDFYINPDYYLPSQTGGQITVADPGSVPPDSAPVGLPTRVLNSPTANPSPSVRPSPTASSSTASSPLDLESVHQLVRDRLEGDLEGQSFTWEFDNLSSVAWERCSEGGTSSGRGLSFQGRKGLWFGVEVPEDAGGWEVSEMREKLREGHGVATGVWNGVLRGVPTGPEWYRLKRAPILKSVSIQWREGKGSFDPSEMTDVVGLDERARRFEPMDKTSAEEPITGVTLEPAKERKPDYRVVSLDRQSLNADDVFERYSPWSLIHLLYQNGEWLLSDAEYEKVESWDRRMRNRFDTFEDPSVRQTTISDFINELGYEKASRVGIVFIGAEGFPAFRWIPQKTDPEANGESNEESKLASEDRLLEDLSDSRTATAEKSHPQNQILEELFADRKKVANGVVYRQRDREFYVEPTGDRGLLDRPGAESQIWEIRNLIELTQAEEVIFRVSPVWLDQIELRFGKADSLKSDPYPYAPAVKSGNGEVIRPGSSQWPSIVWHSYGGVSVGKVNPLVETLSEDPNAVAVRIDIPKWRRLNRPRGLSGN
ncbi:MAG: hypothetical protein H6752_16365 [Candidatus Omnitrophica bacterium]|nr:hypothetical protein [Candidatus Omnitrophota bacterium]